MLEGERRALMPYATMLALLPPLFLCLFVLRRTADFYEEDAAAALRG